MAVSVYVMPLGTYLAGAFRTSWGPDGDGGEAPGPRRSPDEARRYVDLFREQLGRLVPRLREWDESGPARSATTFSADGFALPFLLARERGARTRMPSLRILEPPQIWLPADFEPVFRIAPPWNPESKLQVASCDQVGAELGRLLPLAGPGREEAGRVASRLAGIARDAREHDAPVIIEG
jgi:hypothetical protein